MTALRDTPLAACSADDFPPASAGNHTPPPPINNNIFRDITAEGEDNLATAANDFFAGQGPQDAVPGHPSPAPAPAILPPLPQDPQL